MTDFLVFCEVADGAVKKAARELLGKARELGDSVTAVVLGDSVSGAVGDLGSWGADSVITVEADVLGKYVPGAYADALAQVVEDKEPDVVLASASLLGKDLLPRVAARCDAGCASDVVDLRDGDDGIEAVRPLYAGKCLARVFFEDGTAFFSVRPNSFVIGDVEAGDGAVSSFDADLKDDYGYEVVSVESSGGDTLDLAEADRIIAGGRSLKSAENFAILKSAADKIGAAVGASRAAVDAGYAPHSMQVGQTGKTVNPSLYIAAGISGAIQHLAGMRTSKVIVAINKDVDAPIFQHATYGIEGDLFEAIPLLEKEFAALD